MTLNRKVLLFAVPLAVIVLSSHGFSGGMPAQTSDSARSAWAGVVVSLKGGATSTIPAGKPADLTGIDWIAEGTQIATRQGSELVLALVDGSRFKLGPMAKATVSRKGLLDRSGPIETVGTLSPIPEIAPLTRPVPGQLGAVRIRSRVLRGLYPAMPYTSLADATTLSFDRPEGSTDVRVEIEDETGETVFETRTAAATLRLPAGILRPGQRYFWRVRTIGRPGPTAEGTAEFETLGAEAARTRFALQAKVNPADAGALTLAAEVDRRLGLLREAREGFARVLAAEPGNSRAAQVLAELETEVKALSTAP